MSALPLNLPDDLPPEDDGEVPVHEYRLVDDAGRPRLVLTAIRPDLPVLHLTDPAFLRLMPTAMASAFMVGEESGPYLLIGLPKDPAAPVELSLINQVLADALAASAARMEA